MAERPLTCWSCRTCVNSLHDIKAITCDICYRLVPEDVAFKIDTVNDSNPLSGNGMLVMCPSCYSKILQAANRISFDSMSHVAKGSVVMIGPPASGKTFLANAMALKTSLRIVSSDTIRRELMNGSEDYDSQFNEAVFLTAEAMMREYLENGMGIIFDATNCNAYFRKKTVKKLKEHSDLVVGVVMDVPEDICQARNSQRDGIHKVPESVIHKMHLQLEKDPPTAAEGFDYVIRVGNAHKAVMIF